MPKIRVELEVPNDCRDCEHFDSYLEVCNLFNNDVFYDEDKDIYERCKECKQAESAYHIMEQHKVYRSPFYQVED